MKSKTCLLFISLTIVFFACGKSPSTGGDTVEKKKITFHHYFSGTLSAGAENLVATFNKSSNEYELIATAIDHESFKTSIRQTLETGNPPDLYTYWAGARVQSITDKLEPIDDLWEKENLDAVFSSAVTQSACTYNGKKYLIPITQHYIAFFYNKSVFDKLKLTPPATWEQFLTVCAVIKKAGITPIALGAKQKWPAQFYFDYLLLRSAPYEFREQVLNGKVSYSDVRIKNVFRMWRDLVKAGYFNKSPNDTDWDTGANKMVYRGEAAMTLMGTWIIGDYLDAKHTWIQEKDYDFFPFPVIDASIPKVALGPIDGLVIPSNAVNIDGAKKILFYLSNIETQKAMSKGSGSFAPNTSVQKNFYTPMQQRILDEIAKSPKWAFNYDLSTPPAVAEQGLLLFTRFLEFPDLYSAILDKTAKEIKKEFSKPAQ